MDDREAVLSLGNRLLHLNLMLVVNCFLAGAENVLRHGASCRVDSGWSTSDVSCSVASVG